MMMHDDAGLIFPPRNEWDILLYDTDEVVAGYLDYSLDDAVPGPNHSPAYRWGWTNRRRDTVAEADGFDVIRYAFIRMRRNAA